MANKPQQYKITSFGKGYGIVGIHTGRWVSNINQPMTKKEAESALAELEQFTHDTQQSFSGYYGG